MPKWSPSALPSAQHSFFTKSPSAFILPRHRSLSLGRAFGTIGFALFLLSFLVPACLASVGTSALAFLCLLASVPESWPRHCPRQSMLCVGFLPFLLQCLGAEGKVSAEPSARRLLLLRLCRWRRQWHYRAARLLFFGFSSTLASVPKGRIRHKASALLQRLHWLLVTSCFGSSLCSTSSPLQSLLLSSKGHQKPTSLHNTLCRFRFRIHNDNTTKVVQN